MEQINGHHDIRHSVNYPHIREDVTAYLEIYGDEASPEGLVDQVLDTAFSQFLPIGIDETRMALRELLHSKELKNSPLSIAIQRDPEGFNTLLVGRYRDKVLSSLEDYIGKFIDYIFDDLRRNGTGGSEEKEGQKVSEGMIKFLDDLANLDLGEQTMSIVKKKVREKDKPRMVIAAFRGKIRTLLKFYPNLEPAVEVLGKEDEEFRNEKLKTAEAIGLHLDKMLEEIYKVLEKPYKKHTKHTPSSGKPEPMTLIEAIEFHPRMLRVIEGGYSQKEGLHNTSSATKINPGQKRKSSGTNGNRATG